MINCEQEIASAVIRLGLGSSQISKCEPAEAMRVARLTQSQFVVDDPRVWWLGFQALYETVPYGSSDDWARRLNALIPLGTDRCMLICDCERDDYLVYEVAVGVVTSLLSECSFFEYYLVDPEFRWIIADTDHNQFLLARSAQGRESESRE